MSLLLTLNLFHNFFLLFLLLKLKRSLLAGNYSSNCHVFMFISVLHNMAIMSLQTHFIHWKKFKKLIEKCLLPHWYIDVLIYWYFWHYLRLYLRYFWHYLRRLSHRYIFLMYLYYSHSYYIYISRFAFSFITLSSHIRFCKLICAYDVFSPSIKFSS